MWGGLDEPLGPNIVACLWSCFSIGSCGCSLASRLCKDKRRCPLLHSHLLELPGILGLFACYSPYPSIWDPWKVLTQDQGLESRLGIIWVGSHFWQPVAWCLEDTTFTVIKKCWRWGWAENAQATLGLLYVWWKQQEAGIKPGIAAWGAGPLFLRWWEPEKIWSRGRKRFDPDLQAFSAAE